MPTDPSRGTEIDGRPERLRTVKRALLAAGATLAGMVALDQGATLRPSDLERERARIETVADRFTDDQIRTAWTRFKLTDARPLTEIKEAFPLDARTVHEDGPAIIVTFTDHDGICVDFRTQPDGRIVSARRC